MYSPHEGTLGNFASAFVIRQPGGVASKPVAVEKHPAQPKPGGASVLPITFRTEVM